MYQADYDKNVQDRMTVAHENESTAEQAVNLGLDRVDEIKTIIIAGKIGSGRTTLLNSLLIKHATRGDRIFSVRPDKKESLGDDFEAVVVQNIVDQRLINAMNGTDADVLVFDEFRINSFDDMLHLPRGFGRTMFYVIYASGETPEDIKNDAIKNFQLINNDSNLFGVDQIIVTERTSVDNENAFVATEFLITKIRGQE